MANPWDSDPVVAASPLDAALQAEGVTGPKADLARSIYQQESGSGRNTATSNAGAVGGMQVQPATFGDVADQGWNINDPVHNARAGVRYASQMYDKAGGNPAIAAAGYYGGPGGLAKAQQGVAVSDPRNPDAPNTLQYGAQVAGRMPTGGNPWDNDPIVKTAASQGINDNAPVVPMIDETNNPNYRSDPNAVRIETFGTSETPTPVQAQPQTAQQGQSVDHGIIQQLGDAASAFGHHAMNPLHGAAQLIEHGVNSGIQAIAPNSTIAQYSQNAVNQDDAALAQRERDYQASTPDNAGSYTGAALGEVIPAVVAGGARVISGGADLAGNLAARMGLGAESIGAKTLALGGKSAGSAALGGGLAATQPVLDTPDYAGNKLDQIGMGAAVGGAIPVAGAAVRGAGGYIGNTLRSVVDPFTQSGQNRIAQNTLLRFAKGGPTQVNASELVPGSQPTLAEATGNAGIAGLQRTMRDANPNAFVGREEANADARIAQLRATAGDKGDIAAAIQARDAQTAPALAGVFQNAQPTNATPVIQAIDSILSGPGGQRTAVSSSLNRVRNMLVDPATGTPQSDPATLYQSARKEIGDMLDQRMANANPSGLQASRELLAVRDHLDNAIEAGAPGFKQYLTDYAAASKPISAMEHLQGLNLTDQNGNVTLAKVQNALNGIAKQQGKSGANAAKDINPQQITELQSLRDDLLRQQNLGIGKSVGSPTVQNLAFNNALSAALPGKAGILAGNMGPGGIGSAVGGGLGFLGGGFGGAATGAAAGGFLGKGVGALMNGQNEAIQNRLIQILLDPAAGSAALNRLNGASQQSLRSPLVNRLLSNVAPAGVGIGSSVATRPALMQPN